MENLATCRLSLAGIGTGPLILALNGRCNPRYSLVETFEALNMIRENRFKMDLIAIQGEHMPRILLARTVATCSRGA